MIDKDNQHLWGEDPAKGKSRYTKEGLTLVNFMEAYMYSTDEGLKHRLHQEAKKLYPISFAKREHWHKACEGVSGKVCQSC